MDKYFALYCCFCVRISFILLLIKWSEMDPNVKPHLRNLTLRYWLPASYSLWNRCPRIKDGRKDLVKKGLEGVGALLLQKGVQFSYAIILGIRFWYTTTLFDRSLKKARLPSFLALVFSWSFFKQKCAPSVSEFFFSTITISSSENWVIF